MSLKMQHLSGDWCFLSIFPVTIQEQRDFREELKCSKASPLVMEFAACGTF